MSDRGHRGLDHTADLAIEAWAGSEASLLEEATLAMVELLMDGAMPTATASRTVHLSSFDGEDRLVRLLSEVLYLATGENFVTVNATVTLTDDGVTAQLAGAAAVPTNEIKAVTYHDLSLRETGGRWTARVVFDV